MIIDFDSKNKGGGKEPVVEALSVIENGTYNAPSGVDGYNPVEVNVPRREPVVEALNVTANGSYTPKSGVDGFTPVNVNVPQREPVLNSLSVTDNGTYTPSAGVDGYNSVSVNVPKEIHNVTSKSITANGTYNSTGDDVWNEVSVNVPERQPVLESLSVTENGTYNAPSGVDGYNSVTVNVSQSGGFDTKLLSKLSITQYDENMNRIRSIDVSGNDFSNVQSLQSFAAWNDSLKTVNMSNCIFTSKLSDINYMFQGCTSLETIDFTNCDFSHSGQYSSSFSSAFNSSKLTTIISDGLKLPDSQMDNTGLYESTKLTVDSIVGLLNALPTTTNNYSFQIGETNINKLSDEQKAIATNKGWTLV